MTNKLYKPVPKQNSLRASQEDYVRQKPTMSRVIWVSSSCLHPEPTDLGC